MPSVGQTNSANEWQQQSGGMVSRRGSVVAAFLLCFLAQVRAFPPSVAQAVQPPACTLIACPRRLQCARLC